MYLVSIRIIIMFAKNNNHMRFPFFKQLDAMDCGPSCLRMIAKYHGKNFSVQQLCEKSHILRTGVNLLGLSEAAESIGFRTTNVRTTTSKLKEQAKLPCIIHWNQEHFVVLYKILQKKEKSFFKLHSFLIIILIMRIQS